MNKNQQQQQIEDTHLLDKLHIGAVIGSLRINSTTCVNSRWVAFWLAKPKQECCECGFECKIKVNYRNYDYVLTKKELIKLIKQEESSNDR